MGANSRAIGSCAMAAGSAAIRKLIRNATCAFVMGTVYGVNGRDSTTAVSTSAMYATPAVSVTAVRDASTSFAMADRTSSIRVICSAGSGATSSYTGGGAVGGLTRPVAVSRLGRTARCIICMHSVYCSNCCDR